MDKNTVKVLMCRLFDRSTGEYAETMLRVHGPKGSVSIYGLTPAQIGLLTKAGIEKL